MVEKRRSPRRQEDREIEAWTRRIKRIKKLLLAVAGAFPAGVVLVVTAMQAWRDIISAIFKK